MPATNEVVDPTKCVFCESRDGVTPHNGVGTALSLAFVNSIRSESLAPVALVALGLGVFRRRIDGRYNVPVCAKCHVERLGLPPMPKGAR